MELSSSAIPSAIMAVLSAHQDVSAPSHDYHASCPSLQETKPTIVSYFHPNACASSIHYSPMVSLPAEQAVTLWQELVTFLSHPVATLVSFTPDERTFIIDTGASITITNSISDFSEPPQPVKPTTLKGIASGLSVQGIGTERYSFMAEEETIELLLMNVMYRNVRFVFHAQGI
jgi:hypothetical protein